MRGSASAWSRFSNSKDLKSKSKTSLGSDKPHLFQIINFYEQERRKEKEEEDALEQVF